MAALSIDRAISRLVVLGIRLFLSYLNLKLFFHAYIADIECQNIQRTDLNFVSKKKHQIFLDVLIPSVTGCPQVTL